MVTNNYLPLTFGGNRQGTFPMYIINCLILYALPAIFCRIDLGFWHAPSFVIEL